MCSKEVHFLIKSFLGLVIATPIFVLASATNGTIDSTNKYAHGYESNVGLINFGLAAGNVHVTNSALTGYAWGEKVGWINLAPTYGGVTNNGSGVLSGYAWGELAGWINFNPTNGGVTINSSGIFLGSAWSQNFGWIVFNCATDNSCSSQDIKVSTDWRPSSSLPACNNSIDDDGDGLTDYPADSGCDSATDTDESNPIGNGSPGGGGSPSSPPGIIGDPVLTPWTDIPMGPRPVATPEVPPNPPLPPIVEPVSPPPVSPVGNPSVPENPGLGSGPGSGPGIFSSIPDTVGDGYRAAEAFIKNILTRVPDVVVAVPVVTSVLSIAVVGLVSASNLISATMPFTDSGSIIFRLYSLALGFLGLKKKYRPWGTVYDSVTKQPLDPAYVSLFDQDGKEISSAITDLDGRYGFLLSQGSYTIVANKGHYIFPSKKLAGRTQDELYSDLYFGDPFITGEAGQLAIKNIPMDQEGFDWNEFTKRQKNLTKFYSKRDLLLQRAVNVIFYLGLATSTLSFTTAHTGFNTIIFLLYALMLILRLTGFTSKKLGVIKDKNTGLPLPFAIVTIFSESMGGKVLEKVTDTYGRYFCLVPPGEYYVTVQRKNDDESYTLVYQSPVLNFKKGVIKADLEV